MKSDQERSKKIMGLKSVQKLDAVKTSLLAISETAAGLLESSLSTGNKYVKYFSSILLLLKPKRKKNALLSTVKFCRMLVHWDKSAFFSFS